MQSSQAVSTICGRRTLPSIIFSHALRYSVHSLSEKHSKRVKIGGAYFGAFLLRTKRILSACFASICLASDAESFTERVFSASGAFSEGDHNKEFLVIIAPIQLFWLDNERTKSAVKTMVAHRLRTAECATMLYSLKRATKSYV